MAQQQPPPSAQQPSAQQPSQDGQAAKESQNQKQQTGTSNDRLFWTMPNFLTLENGGKVPPLTTKQKFQVEARSAFDPIEFPWYAVLAGIDQAENSEPEYGQGAVGYGKRYAITFADGTIENFMVDAVMPSLLHQDPRFFQSDKGGFARRLGYAVSRIFVTRTDSGRSQFNYSEIAGSAIAAGISNGSYHPGDERTFSNTMSVWGTQVGLDAITITLKEFWPDIRRKLRGK